MTAEDTRGRLRAESAAELRAAEHETDVDQLVLADVAGVDPAIVSRLGSRKCSNTWTGVDVRMWLSDPETRAVGERLYRWIGAAAGLVVVTARTASAAGDLFALLGDALDAAHGVQRAVVDAVSPHGEDGHDVSVGELEAIVRKASDLERVATETRLAAQAELDARQGSAAGAAKGHRGCMAS